MNVVNYVTVDVIYIDNVAQTNLTVPGEYMSPVRNPLSSVSVTAASILFATLSIPRPYFNSIAALRIVANGFALSCTQ